MYTYSTHTEAYVFFTLRMCIIQTQALGRKHQNSKRNTQTKYHHILTKLLLIYQQALMFLSIHNMLL